MGLIHTSGFAGITSFMIKLVYISSHICTMTEMSYYQITKL